MGYPGGEPHVLAAKSIAEQVQRSVWEKLSLRSPVSKGWVKHVGRDFLEGLLICQREMGRFSQETVHAVAERSFAALVRSSDRSPITLAEYMHALELSDAMGRRSPEAKVLYLRYLCNAGLLKPVPRTHWRVNRTMKQSSDRLRFDLEKYHAMTADSGDTEAWLERGHGSGTCRRERMEKIRTPRLDAAMCDTLYYQIDELLERIIDWEKLSSGGAPLAPDVRKKLCRFFYKILVIEEGKTAADRVTYDEEVMRALENDPNAIIAVLRRKARLLEHVNIVPGETGENDPDSPDEPTFAFDKDAKPDDPSFKKACALLSSSIDNYLLVGEGKRDVYEMLPANPEGTIIGDFTAVRFHPRQFDFIMGVRSTVYVPDDAYADFVLSEAGLLTDKGLSVNDDVRKNYGAKYRIPELVRVLAALRVAERESGAPPMQMRVIRGPGHDPGEDDVPLATVMTRSRDKLAVAQECIYPGCVLSHPEELLSDTAYMRKIYAWQRRELPQGLSA